MSQSVSHASIFGVLTGLASTLVPDGVIPYMEKLIVAFPVAVVGGFGYYFGGLLALKIRERFQTKKPASLDVVIKDKEEP